MKILIVEDEADIREILSFNLEAAGYETATAPSAEAALDLLDDVSLILLDVMLPGMSGYRLADLLRKERCSRIPIIFLTAKTSENDLLTGFSAGGDDYICKPFSIHEVIARVKAVLRRTTPLSEKQGAFTCGPLTIYPESQTATLNGTELDLSRKEYDLLCELTKNPNTYLSRSELINRLWKDTPYIVERTVDVHIARIRNKLGEHRDLIQNRTGFGYYIKCKNESER